MAKKKIINLVGARPQFIKAAALHHALAEYADELTEILVHSGQHYDAELSDVFFAQMQLPKPDYYLNAPKSTSLEQLIFLRKAIKDVIETEKPDAIVVYGDTTTTRAGAEIGFELRVPVAHIEAGLRSYNTAMPEEHNRVIADQLSKWLFVPTENAIANLAKEGIKDQNNSKSVQLVGDIMLDSLRLFADLPVENEQVINLLAADKPLLLATLHRNFNADNAAAIRELIRALLDLQNEFAIAFPVHPRTRKTIATIPEAAQLPLLPPLQYGDMLALEKAAKVILTDSGGIQKEAFYFKKPLVILRPETEWTSLVANNVARLTPLKQQDILAAVAGFKDFDYPDLPQFYGNGHAAEKVCKHLINSL